MLLCPFQVCVHQIHTNTSLCVGLKERVISPRPRRKPLGPNLCNLRDDLFCHFRFLMNSGTYSRPFAYRGSGPYVRARLPKYGVDLDVLTPYCGRMV